jgi:hypothetical protein
MPAHPNNSGRERLRLGGVAEVAKLLAITKSALADRRRHYDFPEPIARLQCGPIWHLDEIQAYANQRADDPHAAYRWTNQPSRQRSDKTGTPTQPGRIYSICPEPGCRQPTHGGLCDHHLRQARRRHQPR